MRWVQREADGQTPAPSPAGGYPSGADILSGRRAWFRHGPTALVLGLGALGLFAPAQAQITVWSATLTVDESAYGSVAAWGCTDLTTIQDNCSDALTDNDFVFQGTTYTIKGLNVIAGHVTFTLDKTTPTGPLTLHLGTSTSSGTKLFSVNNAYRQTPRGGGVTGAVNSRWVWDTTPSWTDNQQVAVKLTSGNVTATASNLTVDNLRVVEQDTLLGLSWTRPSVVRAQDYDVHYTSAAVGTVVNNAAASGNDPSTAWVAVSRSATDTSVRRKIRGLANGTAYRVRVRAKYGNVIGAWLHGTGTPRSSDNSLSALTVESATNWNGPFSPLDLTSTPLDLDYYTRHAPPWVGWRSVAAWEATVPHGTTHVKLRPTVNDPGATVKVHPFGWGWAFAVPSGTLSHAIDLNEDKADIPVEVIAQNGDSKFYWVTVTREAQQEEEQEELLGMDGEPAPTVTLSATPNPVAEGEAVTVTATLSQTLQEDVTIQLTLTRDTSEDDDHDSTVGSITLYAGFESATTRIATNDDTDTDNEQFTVALDTDNWPASVRAGTPGAVTVTIADDDASGNQESVFYGGAGEEPPEGQETEKEALQQQAAAALTASFEGAPVEHDGREPFTVHLRFSEALGRSSRPRAASFVVTGSKVEHVKKTGADRYRLRIKPQSWRDVTVTLAGGRRCNEKGAVCTVDQRPLSNTATATISGPVRIRIKGDKAREGRDATLDFAVTLNRAASQPVTVDYATVDGTATAGEDYTATSGTLTFAPGETAKTVSVPILDDVVDEGKEKFKLKLSNPRGAYLRKRHAEAVGVIRNDDPLPSAWQIRFGRTVSQQVVDALQGRFTAQPQAGLQLTVAGEDLTSDVPLAKNQQVLAKLLGFESVSSQQLVQGSSFSFSPSAGAGPQLSFWGQGALSSFQGREERISLEGDVTTALLGAEWTTERWQAGAALSHSWGSGGYDAEDGTEGEISTNLTGLFPYGRYALTPRLGIWATAGYGWGNLTLTRETEEHKPNANLTMAAAGMDGLLVDGGADGFSLTARADALTVKTTTEGDGLPASEGNVSRFRLGLEASRPFPMANGASFLPTMSIGIRQDTGDAETGFGMDLGAGLSWNDPQRGISVDLKGRTLLTHAAKDFQDKGMAVSFAWDPTPSNRGPSLSMSHSLGAAADGGLDALLNPAVIDVLDESTSNGRQQFETRLAYGFPAFNDRLTVTPALGLALSQDSRTYSLLWALAPYADQPSQADPWELSLEGQRQEDNTAASPVDHALKLLFSLSL